MTTVFVMVLFPYIPSNFFLVKYFAAIGLLVALIELTLLFPLSIYLSQI